MAEGVIKRLVSERGFGFIKPTEGRDLFFHGNQLRGTTFQALTEGLAVEFEIGQGPKGPMATEIRLRTDGMRKRPDNGGRKLPETIDKDTDVLSGAKDTTRARRRALRSRDRKESDWD